MYMYTASVRMVVKFMHVHVCSTHTCTVYNVNVIQVLRQGNAKQLHMMKAAPFSHRQDERYLRRDSNSQHTA